MGKFVSALESWGPKRITYRNDSPPDHAVFNSITDHPEFGDERYFVKIAEKGKTYEHRIMLEMDKQYEVCVFYHNNAHRDYNSKENGQKGIAFNTKMVSDFPAVLLNGETGAIRAMITYGIMYMSGVWSEALVTSSEDMSLHYVEKSLRIQTYEDGWDVNGRPLPEAELFSGEGAFLGVTELDGKVRGGEKYAGKVLYTIRTDQVSAAKADLETGSGGYFDEIARKITDGCQALAPNGEAVSEKAKKIDVEDVRRVNSDLKIEIKWPDDAAYVLAVYGTEEYAKTPQDLEGRLAYTFPRQQYEREAGLYLRNIQQVNYYITLYSVCGHNGETKYSQGTEIFFANRPKAVIYYSIHVKNFFRKLVEIEFMSSEKEFSLPEIDLVYQQGNIPVYRDPDAIIQHIGEQSVEGRYKVVLPRDIFPKDSYLKAFFTDENMNDEMKLRPALDINFKVT